VAGRPDGQAGREESAVVICELEPEPALDVVELGIGQPGSNCANPNLASRFEASMPTSTPEPITRAA
jgi:hypothetical protein